MPKRPDEVILEELRGVENALSPENLHQDGERSAAQVRRALKELVAKKNALIKELGRTPSMAELFD